MSLWIRSQDRKRLVKCEQIIIIEFTDKTECEIFSSIEVKLGTYKNLERAIEVLDEIQDRMVKCTFIKKINGLGEELDLIPNNLLIYQMPKE